MCVSLSSDASVQWLDSRFIQLFPYWTKMNACVSLLFHRIEIENEHNQIFQWWFQALDVITVSYPAELLVNFSILSVEKEKCQMKENQRRQTEF